MKKGLYLLPLLCALALSSCRDVFFAEEPAGDPLSVYETLTDDFLSHYGPATQRGINLDSLVALYRSQLSDQSSEAELWQTCTAFLSHFNDGHVNLTGPGREVFNSNFWFETRTDDGLFDLDMINQSYLGGALNQGEYEDWFEGLIGDSVIYIHFPWVAHNLLELERILAKYPHAEGLILDLRHNQGGDFTFALTAFAQLTQVERIMMQSRTKNGHGPTDWTEWHTWRLESGSDFFDKPIAVLMDRYTISAGERAVMALSELPNVTLIGDTTNGSQSTMIGRELPNGWTYTIPTQETLLASGITNEGIGLAPHLRIVNTQTQVDAGQDVVLEAALALF